MFCSFLMVKMVGILRFLLLLDLIIDVELQMLHSGAIMRTGCILDLDLSLYFYGVGTSFSNMW